MRKVYVLLLTVLFLACGREEESGDKKTTVTVEKVVREKVSIEDRYPASLVALREVELRADVTGYVTKIPVEDGQRVSKGQLLYEIDKSRYQAQLNQSSSRLRIAESNLKQAERDLSRYNKLREGNAIAGQVYDDALTSLENAQQEMVSAQAEVEDAETNLRYADIIAPFDGTIGFSSVRLGALVNPGQTLLNVISENDPMGVDFYAEERNLRYFLDQRENREEVLADSIFSINLPDGSSYPYPGVIENIDRAIDRRTGTLLIRLRFPNPDLVLKPGLSATLVVKSKDEETRLTIPQKALIERLGETYVYYVEDGKAKRANVTLGRRVRDKIIIQEGVDEGMELIIGGLQKVSEGDQINIKNNGEA